MHVWDVCTPGDALAYCVDCTLATVSGMACVKRKSKSEYRRQMGIARQGIIWMDEMGISREGTRAADVKGTDVAGWAKQFEVKNA